jgi:osmotically inducible protein OsmC
MAARRRAEVVWEGNLTEGEGTITSVGSGVFKDLDVTWASRTEESHGGKTSPEELIAAAHASCFSMAFSNILNKRGTPPQRLQVSAESTFVPGTGFTTMELAVKGRVPGIDTETFQQIAEEAKENCPVSKALKGNVDISITAELEGA